jgi:ABC-2 type transport system ATP-binding protein
MGAFVLTLRPLVPAIGTFVGFRPPYPPRADSVSGEMLQATGLTKRYYEHTALDHLDLTIEPGEVFCLLGANGAGKTTTINLFLTFIQPSEGTAAINGLDVVAHPLESKKYVAYIPEQVMLYRNLTGLENLEYFAALAGRRDYTRTQLLGLFKQVDLSNAVLMATHDLFRAKESGTRIGIMKHGRLVETISAGDIGHADLEQLYLQHMKD